MTSSSAIKQLRDLVNQIRKTEDNPSELIFMICADEKILTWGQRLAPQCRMRDFLSEVKRLLILNNRSDLVTDPPLCRPSTISRMEASKFIVEMGMFPLYFAYGVGNVPVNINTVIKCFNGRSKQVKSFFKAYDFDDQEAATKPTATKTTGWQARRPQLWIPPTQQPIMTAATTRVPEVTKPKLMMEYKKPVAEPICSFKSFSPIRNNNNDDDDDGQRSVIYTGDDEKMKKSVSTQCIANTQKGTRCSRKATNGEWCTQHHQINVVASVASSSKVTSPVNDDHPTFGFTPATIASRIDASYVDVVDRDDDEVPEKHVSIARSDAPFGAVYADKGRKCRAQTAGKKRCKNSLSVDNANFCIVHAHKFKF